MVNPDGTKGISSELER